MTLNLDKNAYRDLPEDSAQTPLSHLRTKDNSPIRRRHYEKGLLAQHSSKSWEHYTPSDVIELSRQTLGEIDLDPASSWLAQKTVSSKYWCGLSITNGPEYGWLGDDGLAISWHGTVFLNPPGGHTSLVRPELAQISKSYPVVWWLKLLAEYMAGSVTSAIYIGFSLEQLVTTQRDGTPSLLDFPFCVPKSRICFDYPEDTYEGKPVASSNVVSGKQPSHGNVIVYLPPKKDYDMRALGTPSIGKFVSAFSSIGKVVVP